MANLIMIIAVYVVAIICIPIMKKIEPETYKEYAIYVLAVCVIFTIVVTPQLLQLL